MLSATQLLAAGSISLLLLSGCASRQYVTAYEGLIYEVDVSKCADFKTYRKGSVGWQTRDLDCIDSAGKFIGTYYPISKQRYQAIMQQRAENEALGRQMAEAGKNIADMNKQDTVIIYDYR